MEENILKKVRARWKLKQYEIYDDLSVSRSTYSKWENGRLPIPDHIRHRFERDIDKTFGGLKGKVTNLKMQAGYLVKTTGKNRDDIIADLLKPYHQERILE